MLCFVPFAGLFSIPRPSFDEASAETQPANFRTSLNANWIDNSHLSVKRSFITCRRRQFEFAEQPKSFFGNLLRPKSFSQVRPVQTHLGITCQISEPQQIPSFLSEPGFYKSLEESSLDARTASNLKVFYDTYRDSLILSGQDVSVADKTFNILLTLVTNQCTDTYKFGNLHKQVLEPFDYYDFGNDFMMPLVDWNRSTVSGQHNVDGIAEQLKKGENAVLLANHQTEADPGLLAVLIEKFTGQKELAKNIVYVAGDRVLTDPLCVPFTLGRNILTVFSKRHIDDIPELKDERQAHNNRTLRKMAVMLSRGGCCIYVAPSGGRDRPNHSDTNWKLGDPVEVAEFDSASIELFRVLGSRAAAKTHFYPLMLDTHDIMPPPRVVEADIGERRTVNWSPVHLDFCDEVHLDAIQCDAAGQDPREARARHVWNLVNERYIAVKRSPQSQMTPPTPTSPYI